MFRKTISCGHSCQDDPIIFEYGRSGNLLFGLSYSVHDHLQREPMPLSLPLVASSGDCLLLWRSTQATVKLRL